MVIDDDETIRDLLSAVLADEGYEPWAFADGAAGLVAMRADPPDALILDLHLSCAADGCSIVAQMRADPALAMTPVLLCSGDPEALRACAVLDRPGYAILDKPFDIDDLLAALSRLVQLSSTREE